MRLHRPSVLQALLSELGVAPKKVLSQNFLIDGNIVRKIVDTADVQPEDFVLEIGPGPGVLTEALLTKGAHVLAVEKDDVFARVLPQTTRCHDLPGQLEVWHGDFMDFNLEKALLDLQKRKKKAKVVANLPYHLTSRILAELAPHHELFSSLTVLVQDEVARRFSAKPGTKDYSSFSVFLQLHGSPRYAFRVPRSCFSPAPRVDSAVLHMPLLPPCEEVKDSRLTQLTRTAFQQKRKMLRASLKELYSRDELERALEQLCLPPTARPQDLSPELWIALFRLLT